MQWLKQKFDLNSDGKVDLHDLEFYLSSSMFKGMVGVIVSAIITAIITTVITFVSTGVWSWAYILTAVVIAVTPIIASWFKKIFDTTLTEVIKYFNKRIAEMLLIVQEYENKDKLLQDENQALKISIECKKTEIDLKDKKLIA
jgi:uncharacterized protein YacL